MIEMSGSQTVTGSNLPGKKRFFKITICDLKMNRDRNRAEKLRSRFKVWSIKLLLGWWQIATTSPE
jgi:hypothetical protein